MGINKFEYDGVIKFDLTGDTITSDRLYFGFTAHDKAGNPIVGTLETAPLDLNLVEFDYNIGYVDNGTWIYENPTNTYCDIYRIESGKNYLIMLGKTKGTRFRVMTTDVDIRTKTSGRVSGTRVINTNNPVEFANAGFTSTVDGYLIVAKDNVGSNGIKSYLFNGDAVFT